MRSILTNWLFRVSEYGSVQTAIHAEMYFFQRQEAPYAYILAARVWLPTVSTSVELYILRVGRGTNESIRIHAEDATRKVERRTYSWFRSIPGRHK